MLVTSDEDYGDDKTAIANDDAADDQSHAMSDVALDSLSVDTTSSTLLASDSDEPLSHDAASSANHVTGASDVTARPVGNSRRDLSFVCRGDGDGAGPPWLPASGGTLLHGDRLPSLQYGASGLLALVYDSHSNASQSSLSANNVVDWTAVPHSASSTPSSASFSPSSSSTTVAAAQSSVDVNAENAHFRRADKLPVVSENVEENCLTELSPDNVAELSPSHHSQLSTTANGAWDSSACWMSDVVATSGVVDLPNDVPLLSDGHVERSISPHNVDEPPVSPSTPVLHIEDYLLSDSEETRRGLVNGWTNIDNDEVGVLGHNDVDNDAAGDVIVPDASYVPETLQRVTDVSEACKIQDLSPAINGGLPTYLVATSEMAETDAAVTETSTSLRCNGPYRDVDHRAVCVNGHLQSTNNDADDPRSLLCDDPPSRVHSCDVNSNVTSSPSAISTSGYGDELDETESRDIEKCHRTAEQMSAAWSNNVQPTDVLDNHDNHGDGDVTPPTSTTLTTRHVHVR